MDLALGLVETRGLVGAIEAADAMVKAADVKIISKEKVTGALVIIKVMGETAAVKSSVDAGSAAAQRVGELVSSHVIPRPDDQIDSILFDEVVKSETKGVKKVKSPSKRTNAEQRKPIFGSDKKQSAKALEDIKKVTSKKEILSDEKKPTPSADKKIPPMDELVVLNVHSLRRIARKYDNFPIKGREISKANRAKLLDHFKSMQ